MSEVVLYSDFNCPFCYALNERMIASGLEHHVLWRGVQHAPGIAIPMPDAGPHLASELLHEVRAIKTLAPEIAIELPRGKPNTGPAYMLMAAAIRTDPVKAHALKDSLYRAFWREGVDLSMRSVLVPLAEAAGFVGLEPTLDDSRESARWQLQWNARGHMGVPAIHAESGAQLVGLVSLEQLKNWFQHVAPGAVAATP